MCQTHRISFGWLLDVSACVLDYYSVPVSWQLPVSHVIWLHGKPDASVLRAISLNHCVKVLVIKEVGGLRHEEIRAPVNVYLKWGREQCCSCHATQVDGVLPGRSNRQQSPAGPVNMSRSRTPVAYCLGRQSKLRPFNIGAVYIGSGKPQSCQKPKDKYSTGREYPLLPPSIYACHIYRWNGRFQCTRWLCACSVDLQSGFEPNTMNLPRLPLPSSSGKRLTSHVGSGGIYLFYARQSRH